VVGEDGHCLDQLLDEHPTLGRCGLIPDAVEVEVEVGQDFEQLGEALDDLALLDTTPIGG
jgi:hypothetical protein